MTSVVALDSVILFYASKTLHIHVNICDTVQLLAGFLQLNGRKLEELKNSNVMCFRRLFCVRIKIDQLKCVNC